MYLKIKKSFIISSNYKNGDKNGEKESNSIYNYFF